MGATVCGSRKGMEESVGILQTIPQHVEETGPSIHDSECEICVTAKTKQLITTLIIKTSQKKTIIANIPLAHENP